MTDRWENQEEAVQFALSRPAVMLDMDMGTGKTRVAIDTAFAREDVHKILIVCPKAVVGVWRENLLKFHDNENWVCWDDTKGTIAKKAGELAWWFNEYVPEITGMNGGIPKQFVVINYDSVWRRPMGDYMYKKAGFDMVILDESHRAKSAGSKVSKYLAMVGKTVKYKMCLSGTPMANSPLDVYGQYRFLDNTIFGTNYGKFLDKYAIMGGPDRSWVVGFKNTYDLNSKFQSIAYSCSMSDVADKIKLPDALPDELRMLALSARDRSTMKSLNKEFVAECAGGFVTARNVLVKILRLQQITSGFCFTQENPLGETSLQELNHVKEDALHEVVQDLRPNDHVVVFCVFKHDLESVHLAAGKLKRNSFELSGSRNELDEWKKSDGGLLAVQIQSGAEGVDMTIANHAIYYSLPHSLALFNQSKSRLYRPGQKRPVHYTYLIVENSIDESMYNSLVRKENIIESIKNGEFDFSSMEVK